MVVYYLLFIYLVITDILYMLYRFGLTLVELCMSDQSAKCQQNNDLDTSYNISL